MSGWADSEYREFIEARIKTAPPVGMPSIEAIAEELRISRWTFYDILKGRIDLTPDRIPQLFNATNDIDIIGWLVTRCRGLALRKTNPGDISGDFDDDLENCIDQVNSMFKERRIALEDNILSEHEKTMLLRGTQRLRDIADTIEEEIKRL